MLGGSGAEDASIGDIMGPGFGEHEIADAVERVVECLSRTSASTASASWTPIAASAWSSSRTPPIKKQSRRDQLIKSGAYAQDAFAPVADDAALPEGAVLVSLARFQKERDALLARNTPRRRAAASPARIPELLGDDVHHFSLIALEFPKFRDGRAFSWARMLRTRLGFTGEIRAVGDFLYDQINYQHRVGFDAWEVPDDFTVESSTAR